MENEKTYTAGTVSISSQEYRDLIESRMNKEQESKDNEQEKWDYYHKWKESEAKVKELEELNKELNARLELLKGAN